MPQDLLKRFKAKRLKETQKKIWLLSVGNTFYKSVKAEYSRAIRLHSCESTFIIFIFIIFAPSYVNSSRQNRFKCCDLHELIYIFSFIMELWLLRNVEFYLSFLQIYLLRSLF